MNGISRALLVAAVLVPGLSLAQQSRPQTQPLNYSYVELSYDETDFPAIDGDGFTVAGSIRLTDDWHAYASYGTANLDLGVDFDSWAIGAGYRYGLNNHTDLYGRVLYIKSNFDVPGFGDRDDDGLGLQFRIRSRINDHLEVEGGVQYVNLDDSDTSLQASARYYFTNDFSAAIGITFGGDVDVLGVSARYSF